jgi:1-acyl-sn-glycerol-3-phosphate acyltransferase
VSALGRMWRIVRTGSAFALFGASGAILGLGVLPIVQHTAPDRETGELRAQRWVHEFFRFFVGYMRGVRILDVEVRAAERLREAGGRVVVANHPTLLDVVLLGALMPQLDCVVKRAAWSNPFMRGVVKAAGYVPNDLGEDLIDACARNLLRGRDLLLFPEGTRSPEGGLRRFQRGAAHVALRARRPILPVFIDCDPPSLMRDQRWYEVPDRRLRFTIEVGEALDPELMLEGGEPRGAAARRVTAALRDFYEKRLQTLGS